MSITDVEMVRAARRGDHSLPSEQAWAFARNWVQAWNDHDLALILSYYRDDVELVSPFVRRVDDQSVGKLCGKAALGECFASALERLPNLNFRLRDVVVAGPVVTVSYCGVSHLLAVETMTLDDDGQIGQVEAEYRPLAA